MIALALLLLLPEAMRLAVLLSAPSTIKLFTNPAWLVILTPLTAAAASWFTWRQSKRTTSGSSETSDAATLWSATTGFAGTQAEFMKMILGESDRMRAEVVALRKDSVDSFNDTLELRRALDDAKRENVEVHGDNHRLRNLMVSLERELSDCDGHVAVLTNQIKALGAEPVPRPETDADAPDPR